MGYYVNYAGMNPEARREAALEDIKTWLGPERFTLVENHIRPFAAQNDTMSFFIAASFAGIEGVPASEWFLHLGGSHDAWEKWLAGAAEQ